jgi:hypothetical protein
MYIQKRKNVLGKIHAVKVDGNTAEYCGQLREFANEYLLWHYLDAIGPLLEVVNGEDTAFIRPFGSGYVVGMVGAKTEIAVRDLRTAEKLAHEIVL